MPTTILNIRNKTAHATSQETSHETSYETRKFIYLFELSGQELKSTVELFKLKKQKTVNVYVVTNDNKALFCTKNISFSLSYILNKLNKTNKVRNFNYEKIIKCIRTLYYEEFITLIRSLINLNLINTRILMIFSIKEIEAIFFSSYNKNSPIHSADISKLVFEFRNKPDDLYNILLDFKMKYIFNREANIDLRFEQTNILIGEKLDNNLTETEIINRKLYDMFGGNYKNKITLENVKYVNRNLEFVNFDKNFEPLLITEVYDKVLNQSYFDISYIIQIDYSLNEVIDRFNKNKIHKTSNSSIDGLAFKMNINTSSFTKPELLKLIKY